MKLLPIFFFSFGGEGGGHAKKTYKEMGEGYIIGAISYISTGRMVAILYFRVFQFAEVFYWYI